MGVQKDVFFFDQPAATAVPMNEIQFGCVGIGLVGCGEQFTVLRALCGYLSNLWGRLFHVRCSKEKARVVRAVGYAA